MMSRRTYPNPHLRRFRPHTPSSWPDCPTPEPIQLRALCPRCGPLPLLERSFASGEDVSDVTDHRGPRLARLFGEEAALESLQPRRLPSCRSRRARARNTSDRSHDLLRLVSGFAPVGLVIPTDRSRSRAIGPVLASARRHSRGEPGELGRLPFRGAQRVGWDFRAHVGAARRRPRSIRPMSAAHGFCFQERSPQVSAHAAPQFPRGGEPSVHAEPARFGEPTERSRSVFFSERRSIGVPLMPRRSAGFPSGAQREAVSTGVGPRSPKRPRVEPESLGLLRQAA